jgi:nitric oxide reductase activation protein
MLAPDLRKKFNKLYDGEEIDLDAVVRAVVERKAGHVSDEKIYWKRRKVQRDVAAILLLDMSASTGVIIKEADDEEYPDWYLDLMETSPRLRAQSGEVLTEGLRRVIDVAKESVVLMINALEVIGDCYGVYGFSGRGRENVELLVIKGMDEEFSGTVKRRIGSISPLHGTRMGPAIRHTTSKLEACDAKTKILFLVSDGYPQDEDYGQDNNDREYALQDTRMAFFEAKRKNIIPFCLTVDIAGYDYLKRMCHDIDYEVVNNIESLPQRLPILYKRLTS